MAADPNAQQYEQEAAAGTGIPFAVTHQQALAESGEQDSVTSSAGAHGFWQFLASTYNPLAGQAGVPQNSYNNPADETKVYVVYMNELLKQEGGSVFKALEAYNAGPGNLSAGAGYAAGILSKAGLSQSVTAGTPNTGASATANTTADVFGIPGTSALNPATWISDLGGAVLKSLGVPSMKDLMQRLALILFGAALVLVGIHLLSTSSSGSKSGNSGGGGGGIMPGQRKTPNEPQSSTEAISSGGAGSGAVASGTGASASEALEMAAVA